MPRVPIDDLDDPRVAIYRHLKATNLTRAADQFVVEGEKLLDRLLASRFPTASVLATDRHERRVAAKVPPDVPLFVVPHEMIDLLVGFNFHRGVLASGRRRPGPDLAGVVRDAGPRATVVVCPSLNNPENLGSIVRIGDVFGVDAVVVGGRCPDPSPAGSCGSRWARCCGCRSIVSADLAGDLDRLRSGWGFKLAATVLDPSAEPLDSACRPDRLALLLGREDEGLEPEWIERCDRRITIPMRPGAESLNVAVAAGIVLYHFSRTMHSNHSTD